MVEEILSSSERRLRRAEHVGRERRIPVAAATVLTDSPPSEPVARVTPEPARRAAAVEAPRVPEVPTVPAAVHTSAAEQAIQTTKTHVQDTFGVSPRWMDRWWKRGTYILTNGAFGGLIGKAALVNAAYYGGLTATGVLPAILWSMAIGVPAVLAARWMLGLHVVDRAVAAGRTASKAEKEIRALDYAARRSGGEIKWNDAQIRARVEAISKKRSWGALLRGIAGSIAGGSIGYESFTASPDDRHITNALHDAWKKGTDPSWWSGLGSWMWGTVCQVPSTGGHEVATPVLSSHTDIHSHLGSGIAAQAAVEAASQQPALAYNMDIKPLVPILPEASAFTHLEASQMVDKLPDTSTSLSDLEDTTQKGLEVTTIDVPPPTLVRPDIGAGHAEFSGFDSKMSAPTAWDGFGQLMERVGETPDDFTQDIFDDYMEDSASKTVWADFFGKKISAGDTFQELARTFNGTQLDYSVLNKNYHGIVPLDEMIERAQDLGNTAAVEKLQAIRGALTSNPNADLTLRIRGR